MGWAGVALSLVGSLAQAGGQAQAGKDARKAEEYNAGVLRANAEAVRTSNEFDLLRMKKSQKRFTGAQAASYASAGVRSEGSPLEVMIDSAAQAELDMFISKYNAQTQAQQLRNEADQRIKMGKAAQKSGQAQATGTLLSAAGSAASSYGKYKTTGSWY